MNLIRVVNVDVNDDRVVDIVIAVLRRYNVGHSRKVANSVLAAVRRFAESIEEQ
jgi:hypothetical protein